jgi:hypothetical protein
METRYLVLRFRNAKLFRNRKDGSCKDYVFDMNIDRGYRKRMDKMKGRFEQQFIEPITVHQISNLLHVLFNERPVPSHRDCLYSKIDYLFEKAKNSYLRYTNCDGGELTKLFNNKKNEEYLPTETIKVSKAVWDSFNPSPQINWDIIKQYLGSQENIDWFFKELKNLLNKNPIDYNVDIIRLSLLTKNLTNLFDGLEQRKRKGLVDFINNNTGNSITSNNDRISLTVNSGIENVIILNGEILIPVDDNDIIKLRLSKGCATILDGGYVWIDSLKDSNEIGIDGFTMVGEISTEKY